MTLCLAWKDKSKYYFSSDSRLRNESGIITDKASKIFKINIRILGPSNREKTNTANEILLDSSYGLCFAGSYLNGSLLADTMNQVLTNLQGAPNFSDFSFSNLSNIAFNIYKQVSTQLMEINQINGLSNVLFGGHCIEKSKYIFYEFGFKVNAQIDFYKNELNDNDFPKYIGDNTAKGKATELAQNLGTNYSHFHILRDIIVDTEINTVGGDIQTGIFENKKFDTHGILEYHIENNAHNFSEVKTEFKYRGIKIDYDNLEQSSGNIHRSISFINPFENERNQYHKEIIRGIDEDIANQMK
jgi:hypothetical protein